MYRGSCVPSLTLAIWLLGWQGLAAEEPATITWRIDYSIAMDLANQQRKMLLIFFCDPANVGSQRLDEKVFTDAAVCAKLQEYVCLRLPMDASTKLDGQEVRLLQHAAFKEMLGQPGIAIADFAHSDPRLRGNLVSAFPLTPRFSLGPEQMKAILDLPCGTITQRTLIYAVRTHPECPASAIGEPDARLLSEAESHSAYQAQIHLQGHHRWQSRFARISAMLGGTAREVCAESWPGQTLVDAAVECVRCWRCSPGHWSAVRSCNCGFGYDMKLGSNGVWYATGIFGS